MSHQPERKEKNCLNCGTLVEGRFCQACGQENIVAKQSFGSLIRHFVYDIFHFDGKFFDTVKFLLFQPGKVPRQYVSGKRVSYLDPIRMYLFTSAVFFLVFFTIGNAVQVLDDENNRPMTQGERLEYASILNKKPADSATKRQLHFLLDTSYRMNLTKPASGLSSDSSFFINLKGRQYLLVAEKIDTSQVINIGTRIFGKNLAGKSIRTNGEEIESGIFVKNLLESFLHKLPYLLFVSLPFFALILKLLYRRKKEFFYSDHAVFTLYHYIFSFLLLLVLMILGEIGDAAHWKVFDILQLVLFFCGGLYLYIAMLRFYGQRWGKTLAKFLLLNVLGFFMLLILFLIFIIYSLFQQ